MGNSPNRVRERRESRGLSQTALAAETSLSRQSVGAIEAGRATPSVDVALRIAAALDCRVEELFGAAADAPALLTEPVSKTNDGRLALAHIAGRWVSHRLDRGSVHQSADALSTRRRGAQLEVELTRSSVEARNNVLVMGCAAGLAVLGDRLNAQTGPGRFVWLSRSSTEALEALAKDQIHVAGVHLVDSKTGESNIADVRRLVRGRPVTLITLARWEVGLVVGRGNPKKLRSAADLGRRGLRIVHRERGSGARRLLERELHSAGVPLEARGSGVEVNSHFDVAHAVAIGAGDAGVASRDAAIELGTDFIPLTEERYDLVVASAALEDPRIQRVLDVLSSAGLRRELSSLGYDVRSCGERVAELNAA